MRNMTRRSSTARRAPVSGDISGVRTTFHAVAVKP
jgi:hypothetical protein